MPKDLPAVLLGLSYTSLPVARSLGRRGITVFGMDRNLSGIGAKSRYVRALRAPATEQGTLEILNDLAQRCGSKAVLFPFSDEYVLVVSRNRDQLKRHFLFPCAGEFDLECIVSKEAMANTIERLKIAAPKTVILDRESLMEARFPLTFPVVLKPNRHARWLNNPEVVKAIGVKKALLIDDHHTLLETYEILHSYDTLIAQEFVPGRTENLYYYVGYRSQSGQMLVSFVGRKLRTLPDMFGSESLLQSIHDPALCKLGDDILGQLNYVGPAGLDFKFDARDQTFKLIEINCRLGLSDGLLVSCGVDIPYIYYQDVSDAAPSTSRDYHKDVFWWWLEKDIEWFREYGHRYGFSPLAQALHLFRNKYSYAAYAPDDLGPFVHVVGGLAMRAVRKLARSRRADG